MAEKKAAKKGATAEIDEAAIRALADETVFERGRAYRDEGAVSDLVRRGDTVTARVEGSETYRVTVRIDGARWTHTPAPAPTSGAAPASTSSPRC